MAFNHVDRDYSIVPVTVTQLVAWKLPNGFIEILSRRGQEWREIEI